MSRKPPRPGGRPSGRKPGIALLGIADTYIDAMMWKDMLEQQGIPCMVRDGSATIGDLQGALPGPGHMEVYVPASALQRSRDILGVSLPSAGPTTTPGVASVSWMWLLLILGRLLVAGVAAVAVLL